MPSDDPQQPTTHLAASLQAKLHAIEQRLAILAAEGIDAEHRIAAGFHRRRALLLARLQELGQHHHKP